MKEKSNLLGAIIDEATRQFLANGYKNLNIDELVNEIGISKATFYKYIPSKEILFEESIRRYLEKFKKEISKQIKQILKSNKETFFKFFIKLIRISGEFISSISNVVNPQIEKRFPQINLKLREFTKKQIENSFFSIVKKGREIGVIRNDISTEVLYFIIYTTLLNLKSFAENQNKLPVDRFFFEYFYIIFNGILVEDIKPIYYKQIMAVDYEK
ncbi:MAG: TetR/AcrR family transcriptional regulator [Bacteroidota bacterium]